MSIDTRGVDGNVGQNKGVISDPERHVKMAIKHAADGDFDEAISELHEVTRSRPDYLQAWTAKAVLYRLMGDDRMALLCSRTAKQLRAKK